MRRLPALLLATLVLALPAQAAEPAPRVKNTKGEIESIAMDGPRVAYAVKSDTCTKVIVLNVLTRSAAVAMDSISPFVFLTRGAGSAACAGRARTRVASRSAGRRRMAPRSSQRRAKDP